jgi:hypothetical protein
MNVVEAVHLHINKTGAHNWILSCAVVFFRRHDEPVVCHNDSTCTMEDVSIEKLTAGDLAWHVENVVGFLVERSLGRRSQTNVREADCC